MANSVDPDQTAPISLFPSMLNLSVMLGNYLHDFSRRNFQMHFLCPQRNFGRHIVIALSVHPSVRPCVRPSRFSVRSISPIFFEVGISN